MKTTDFSKEIYEKYFGKTRGPVVITLRDKTVLVGKLTGFFRGEKTFGEPFITRWRFVNEDELKEIDFFPHPNQELGLIIHQKDIERIHFK